MLPGDLPHPTEKEALYYNDWLRQAQENMVMVGRHGKIDPFDSGNFTDFGNQLINPFQNGRLGEWFNTPSKDYSRITLGEFALPRIDTVTIARIAKLDQDSLSCPRVVIQDHIITWYERNPIADSFAIKFEGMQKYRHPKETRGPTFMEVTYFFNTPFGPRLANALVDKSVSPRLLLELYDRYYPPKNRELFQEFSLGSLSDKGNITILIGNFSVTENAAGETNINMTGYNQYNVPW